VIAVILFGLLAGYLIGLALIWRRRWTGRAPADVLARHVGEVVTIGVGAELVTERTGRLAIDPSDSSLSLVSDERVWQIRLGDVRWLVDVKTGAKIWLQPPR